MNRILLRLAAALVLVGASALSGTTTTTAHATPPGHDGPIVFRRYLGPDRTNGAIFTIAPNGARERQLTHPSAQFSDDFPDFAADSRFVAFQRCGETCRIFTVRSDGSGLRSIGRGCRTGQQPPACSDNSYPAISPDGRWIAFVRAFGEIRDDQIDHVGIYIMRRDGSHLRRVTLPATRTAEDNEPQWSPDGRHIVFVRENVSAEPAGHRAVFTVNVNGRHLRRITPWEMNAGDGPDWSPDGSRILFRAPETEDFLNSNYFTIRPDGSGLHQVTHVPRTTKLYSASYSPEGDAITFGSTGVNDQADVFTMRLDGSAVSPVTRTPQWDSAPDWGGTRCGRRH
jgi:Tol biopolymer transport system component